jgi:hypothetical protein
VRSLLRKVIDAVLAVVGCFVGVVGFFVIVIALLATFVEVAWRDRRLRQRLPRDRRMRWSALQWSSTGTFILETIRRGALGFGRVWWTEEDLYALAPMRPPADEERHYSKLSLRNAFARWVYEGYTHPSKGKAKLLEGQEPREGAMFRHLKERFPRSRVVQVARPADEFS